MMSEKLSEPSTVSAQEADLLQRSIKKINDSGQNLQSEVSDAKDVNMEDVVLNAPPPLLYKDTLINKESVGK